MVSKEKLRWDLALALNFFPGAEIQCRNNAKEWNCVGITGHYLGKNHSK